MFGRIFHLLELVHKIHDEFKIALGAACIILYYFADLQAREEQY